MEINFNERYVSFAEQMAIKENNLLVILTTNIQQKDNSYLNFINLFDSQVIKYLIYLINL